MTLAPHTSAPWGLVLLLAISGACQAPTDDPAQVVRGPLGIRQQHPISLTLMAFRPRRAVTQPKGEFRHTFHAAWSTFEEVQPASPSHPNDSVVVDAETIRATYRSRYGLGEHLDVEVEIPFLYAGGGGLDALIEDYHDLLGLPQGGRDLNKDDQFEVSVSSGGDTLYELEGHRIGLQDIPIFLTYQVLEETREGPALATRVGLELPTGSESKGYGNGAFDYGVGLLAERSLGRWTFNGAIDFTVPGQSDRLRQSAGHRYDPQWAFELGAEFRWNDDWSLVGGTIWTSPILDSVELEEIDSPIFDLGLGMIHDVGRSSRFAISVHEDLVAATGSDVTLQLGWIWGR